VASRALRVAARLAVFVSLALPVATTTHPAASPVAPSRWIEPTTGMQFVQIQPGRFVMGSPADEPGREAQERQHAVTISRSFWMGAYEVTQAQWQRVMGTDPSRFTSPDGSLPVEQVTWHDAHEFLGRLTARSHGWTFRLPTEAEWEYACRAGTTSAYSVGATLTSADANITPSPDTPVAARGQTITVGSFRPNAWGLYDMHGNVWEWTEDDHCAYSAGPVTDPVGACGAPLKVIRGGSWYFAADSARCALRYTHRAQDRGFSLGFRAVATATAIK
jgi:formylglycine-generating enzyme required for sulfatase activity